MAVQISRYYWDTKDCYISRSVEKWQIISGRWAVSKWHTLWWFSSPFWGIALVPWKWLPWARASGALLAESVWAARVLAFQTKIPRANVWPRARTRSLASSSPTTRTVPCAFFSPIAPSCLRPTALIVCLGMWTAMDQVCGIIVFLLASGSI